MNRQLSKARLGVAALRTSAAGRSSLRNALYGGAEYVAMPVTMLLATPFLLHRLGVASYGLWMLTTAAITSSGFISTGFGDAALKYAATYRGQSDRKRLQDTLRVSLTINLVLGSALALLMWCLAPAAVRQLLKVDQTFYGSALVVFRIAAVVLLIKSVESVFVGALRAFERYGPAVQINIASRILTILCACALVIAGRGVVAILLATLVIAIVSALAQMIAVRVVAGALILYPSINQAAFAEVFNFGFFSWLQALAGCIFNYADRLLIGFMLGVSSVAYYSICVQAAQPIHGLIAAGLHFLFPHLSNRMSTASSARDLRPVIVRILAINVALAVALTLPLAVFSKLVLRLWMGPAVSQQAWMVLSVVAVGYCLLAFNITGHYALLALGEVRLVSMLNVLGGVVMLAGVILLAPRMGVVGAAIGRLFYGPITLLIYFRLRSLLAPKSFSQNFLATPEPAVESGSH